MEELSQRAREGKPLYGESHQPEWVQAAAFRNSQFSQLKFCTPPPQCSHCVDSYSSTCVLAAFPM